MTPTTTKYRAFYFTGSLAGTAISCLCYGGCGFLFFGLAGLYGGLKLGIILAVLQLLAIEIFLFKKAGGIANFCQKYGIRCSFF